MLLCLAISLAGLHRAVRLGSCSVGRNHCAQLVLYFFLFFFILFPCVYHPSAPSALGDVGVNITFCIATCQMAGMEQGRAAGTPTARR